MFTVEGLHNPYFQVWNFHQWFWHQQHHGPPTSPAVSLNIIFYCLFLCLFLFWLNWKILKENADHYRVKRFPVLCKIQSNSLYSVFMVLKSNSITPCIFWFFANISQNKFWPSWTFEHRHIMYNIHTVWVYTVVGNQSEFNPLRPDSDQRQTSVKL